MNSRIKYAIEMYVGSIILLLVSLYLMLVVSQWFMFLTLFAEVTAFYSIKIMFERAR